MNNEMIFLNLKKRFKELTQKDNYKIYKNKYFIPLKNVFNKRINQAILEYDLSNYNRLNEVLISYVEECIKDNFSQYTRTIEYYIYGQNGKDCMLADDYINKDCIKKEENLKFKTLIK